MATSIKDFLVELYREHLSEASFLYEQRLTLFEDPEITWLDIEDFENRFEPHIDALVVREDLALEVCKQQASEGDFGELHAAVLVFCRQRRKDLLLEVLEKLDSEDVEKICAVSDALKYELPDEWQGDLVNLLTQGERKLVPVAAEIIGYRRISAGRELLLSLERNEQGSLVNIIWALGRLREKEAKYLILNKFLRHEDEAVRSASALALLRLGAEAVLNDCVRNVQSDWAVIPLALGGNRSVVAALLQAASARDAGKDFLTALGLLGDIAAVEFLMSKLAEEKLATSAATALFLITGAGIYEDAFIPEEIDKDELFDEELEQYKQGKAPTRPDGKPFGVTITRLSQKPDDWQKWWKENKLRFDPGLRYRNGKPFSLACLLENLESPKYPHKVRQLAYEEMVVRYGMDLSFEADMSVAQQKQALSNIVKWIRINVKRFQEGKWYFSGKLI